jgi:hypothetical protein
MNRIHEFPGAVLISGCQRSGGTMLASIISRSDGMVDFSWSKDDELDGAQILSGYKSYNKLDGRYCFQTTYVNECYPEYFQNDQTFKVIWLLRNPYSVIYSLLHNWSNFALNELFCSCGSELLPEMRRLRYERFGHFGIKKLERACYSYNAKTLQAFKLLDNLGAGRVMVIDYNDLVKNKHDMLPKIYNFIDLAYQPRYAESISTLSLEKANRLSSRERSLTDELCMPVYENAKKLLSY